MPKSKLKLIRLQLLALFFLIVLPLTYIVVFQVMFTYVWNRPNQAQQSNARPAGYQELEAGGYRISFLETDGWYGRKIAASGSKEQINRSLEFRYANTFSQIDLKLSEVGNQPASLPEGAPRNGFQKENFVEFQDESKAVVLFEDIAGQKIARVPDPKNSNNYLLIDLHSKKLGEKDLNNKNPQSDRYYYNTRLNLFPEIAARHSDRSVLVEVSYTVGTGQDVSIIDNRFREIKLID